MVDIKKLNQLTRAIKQEIGLLPMAGARKNIVADLQADGLTAVTGEFLDQIDLDGMEPIDWQEIYERLLAPRLELLKPLVEAIQLDSDGVFINFSAEYTDYTDSDEQSFYDWSQSGLSELNCMLEEYEYTAEEIRKGDLKHRSPRVSDYDSTEELEQYNREYDPGDEDHWRIVKEFHRASLVARAPEHYLCLR